MSSTPRKSLSSLTRRVRPSTATLEHLGVFARGLALALLMVGITLASSGIEVSPARAQQHLPTHAPGPTASRISLASSGFGPIALNAIIEPDTLERIARELRDKRWQIPRQDTVWPSVDGKPVVKTPRVNELWHTIQPGETLRRLRKMYKVNIPMLTRLNPGINLRKLEIGQRIRVWKRKPGAVSQSYGAANGGRLYHGEPLPESPYYRILYPHRTFGTYYTVSEVTRVMRNYYEAHPKASKLIIGDISYSRGRKIHPHASHRTGRDIDISYPRVESSKNLRRFHRISRGTLDVPRTLAMLKDFLDGGYVKYVFMDHWIQKKLRAEALRQGATQEWVERVFQYPERSGGTAIVRYSPGHKNHFHIRFICQPTDRKCE